MDINNAMETHTVQLMEMDSMKTGLQSWEKLKHKFCVCGAVSVDPNHSLTHVTVVLETEQIKINNAFVLCLKTISLTTDSVKYKIIGLTLSLP